MFQIGHSTPVQTQDKWILGKYLHFDSKLKVLCLWFPDSCCPHLEVLYYHYFPAFIVRMSF